MTETQAGSGAVLRAKEYLKSVTEGKAAPLPGPYTRQIAGLYDRLMNGTAFRYDAAKAPLPALHENRNAEDEATYQWYLRLLGDAARDGTEVDAWRI